MTQVHADVAAALQERTEQVMLHLARRAREVTGSRWLCAGGGVVMNCVAIGKIIREGLFDEVFVPPAPGDSGTAIGAAIAAHLDLTGAIPSGVGTPAISARATTATSRARSRGRPYRPPGERCGGVPRGAAL